MVKTRSPWWIFAGCCALSCIIIGLVINASGLFHTYISESLEVPRARVAMMQTVQAICTAVALMLSRHVFARINLTKLMTTGVIVVGGGLILSSTFTSVYQFYVIWGMFGLFLPFLFSLTIPTMLSNWFEKSLATVTGVSASLTGIGGAVFNKAVAASISHFGWRSTYVGIGITVLVTLLPFTLLIFKMRPDGAERPYGHVEKPDEVFTAIEYPGDTIKEARRMPAFYLFIVSVVFLAMASGFMQQISPHVQTLGFDINNAASVMSGVMVGIAGGKIIMGFLLDRFKPQPVIAVFCGIGFCGWFGLTQVKGIALLIGCGVLVGLAHSISQVVLPVTVRRTFGLKEYTGIYAGITLFSSATSAFMPFFGSKVYDMMGSYSVPITVAACAFIAAMPCLIVAAKYASRFK